MVSLIRRLFIVVVFAVLFADCSEDPTVGLCQLQTDSFSQGTTTVTTYVYVEHQLMSQTTTAPGYSLALNYKYNVNGQLSLASAEKNGVTGKITYDYGINNQLVRSVSIFGTDTVTTTYAYNDQAQLIKKIQAYAGAVLTDSLTADYLYPDIVTKNPSSIITTQGSTLPDTTLYQYDNKINPFRDFFPTTQSYNNVVRIQADGADTTISYTYNELGYPVSATWSTGEVQSFSYKCE